jgi:hypothetical protein
MVGTMVSINHHSTFFFLFFKKKEKKEKRKKRTTWVIQTHYQRVVSHGNIQKDGVSVTNKKEVSFCLLTILKVFFVFIFRKYFDAIKM